MACELPSVVDEDLVASGHKAKRGPLRLSSVEHRLAVLSKFHKLRRLDPNPCEDPAVRHLLAKARRAAWKRGEVPRKKTAATREMLEAMIATCDDTLVGVRDRALLLFAWASGGRRRSETVNAYIEQLSAAGDGTYVLSLRHTKTNQDGSGVSVDKPIRGKP